MTLGRPCFSSVTRWLLMVVGCAVLETAQPMMAETESVPPVAPDQVVTPPRSDETVIYPAGVEAAPEQTAKRPNGSSLGGWFFAALVGFGAAGLWWWTRRGKPSLGRNRINGLSVEQTHSLGNRQYLVVAGVDGRRFLLGVTSTQINLLSGLDPANPAEESSHD